MSDPVIAVCPDQPDAITHRLQTLAGELHLPSVTLSQALQQAVDYWLRDVEHVLQLQPVDKKRGGPLFVDFNSGAAKHRREGSGIRQEIAKAVGCKSQYRPTVLDVTAGLGGDAFVLACLGCTVTLVENNPLVYLLLADGLERAQQLDSDVAEIVSSQMQLLPRQNSLDYLAVAEQQIFDVVYLDPMFPERKKSAKVKKGMQYFHDIVGLNIEQEAELLGLAQKVARKRVVVKRPKGAPELADKKPSFTLSSKTLRYDVYVNS